ncbi:uncharacterized protein LOC122507588 [Leptopilina heterotoma]|uniref:uncharacterized protein LOC122507588 n=1 Tax=Leptopilina heterotoma TaxID=63436 RepID=UPI001CA84B97|nr:uncharacterized protein LOC122507588 [Leptopilina heterotoma]
MSFNTMGSLTQVIGHEAKENISTDHLLEECVNSKTSRMLENNTFNNLHDLKKIGEGVDTAFNFNNVRSITQVAENQANKKAFEDNLIKECFIDDNLLQLVNDIEKRNQGNN